MEAMPPAILLAGGSGTRLRAAVSDRPKPLAWVAGRPFICYLLEQLERAGVRRCILAIGYKADAFERTLGTHYGPMALEYVVEETPLGTGGCLRETLPRISEEYSLVLNGDSYIDVDLTAFYRAAQSSRHEAALVIKPAEGSRYGNIVTGPDNTITAFREKQSAEITEWMNAGVYLLQTRLLKRIPLSGAVSLERDIFPSMAAEGRLGYFKSEGRFLDIGLPESYYFAQQFFRPDLQLKFADLNELLALNPDAARMFDQNAGINAWKLAVGVVVRNKYGQILLERRADCGFWSLLGGRLNFGESLADAALREVREETGLSITIERVVGVYSVADRVITYPGGDSVQPVVTVVEAYCTDAELQKSEESLELRFFAPGEIPREVWPGAQQPLEDCLQSIPAQLS